jgi:hypothetical protein
MKERYTKVHSVKDIIYPKGFPIVILASALYTDNAYNTVCLQIKMQSLSDKILQAVYIEAIGYDIKGNIVENKPFGYLDLNVSRNSIFGDDKLIHFDNGQIRKYVIRIVDIIFDTNESATVPDSVEYKRLSLTPISFEQPYLLDYYKEYVCSKALYRCIDSGNLWICTCGSVNASSNDICYSCCTGKLQQLKFMDSSALKERIYNKACELNDTNDASSKKQAERIFLQLGDFKDSIQLAKYCRTKQLKQSTKKRIGIYIISFVLILAAFDIFRPSGLRYRYRYAQYCSRNGEEKPYLYESKMSGKIGFINDIGLYVIWPKYDDDEIRAFSCGLAAVKDSSGKWGYIDTSEEYAIEPLFNEAYRFSEELAAVKDSSGKWGYIDETGKFVIGAKFDEARSFSEGLAAVKESNGKWGYIDGTGKFVIEAKFADAFMFYRNTATVYENNSYRYIDKKGNYVD